MSTREAPTPSNFIRQIIDEDIKQGKHGGRVATRFPPEPNGYLHIGHAKSICLNFGIAQDYNGTCNLRFDDTNPEKESEEFVEAIKEDVRWLGFEWTGQFFASDYFPQLYQFAEQLIRAGKAYVCDLSPEEMREYRGTLTEPGRDSRLHQEQGKLTAGGERQDEAEHLEQDAEQVHALPGQPDEQLRVERLVGRRTGGGHRLQHVRQTVRRDHGAQEHPAGGHQRIVEPVGAGRAANPTTRAVVPRYVII